MLGRIVFAAAFAACLPATLGAAQEFYPPTPETATDPVVAAFVNGQPAALEYFRNGVRGNPQFMETSRLRFATDGPVDIEVRLPAASARGAALRALGRDLRMKGKPGGFSFRLPGPGHYYLQLPGLAKPGCTYTVLFWLDDLRRVKATRIRPDAPGVVDITTRGVRSSVTDDQTAALQAILDRAGTIYFPPGIYRAGTLRIGSDTTIYMAPGAMLRAVDVEANLKDEFLAIENARNVRIAGQGTIDANGGVVYGHNVHLVNITSSRDITFEDVLLQNTKSWAVHVRRSDRFSARHLKVFSGKDGFDPDSSRDVTIENVFVVSIDDAFAVKNRYAEHADGRTTERVLVRNAIVSSTKSALKIGTETEGPIRDVQFIDCDVYDGDRGIALYARDGGPIENITWRNIRLFMFNWPEETASGRALLFSIAHRRVNGKIATPVRNVNVANVSANFMFPSIFAGLADAPLADVSLRDIRIAVELPKDGAKHPLFECGPHAKVRVEELVIDWRGNESRWAGLQAGDCLVASQ